MAINKNVINFSTAEKKTKKYSAVAERREIYDRRDDMRIAVK